MSLTITIPGAVNVTTGAMAPAVLTIGVGVPGAAGPQGPAGQGVPAGGTAGQFLTKIDGTNYNTDWTTVNLSGYAPLASPAFTGNPTAPTATLGDNDTSIATTAFVQQELASGTAVAKNLEVYVRNQTGSTIPAGSIVYINGATGNRPTITLAQANNDANSAQTFGFTKAAISNNGFGYVIVRGELENIDTSALTEGVQLYLSPTTAGTWTTTKPSAPQHLVYVGICVRAHPTQGVILVAVQNGYELPELHDVKITSPTNGQVLKYDSAQSLWVNGTDSAGVAWGGITGTLSSQTDLQSALDAKLAVTTAASTYYLQSNPDGFITSAALGGYATESWVNSQGYLTGYAADFIYIRRSNDLSDVSSVSNARTNLGLGTMATATAADYSTTTVANGLYYPLSTNPAGYLTSASLTGYATESWVTAGFYPLTGNPSSFLVAADITGKANLSGATFTGLVNTLASSTAGAGFRLPHGAAPTTPTDGDVWSTTGGLFWRQNAATKQAMNLSDAQTISGGITFSSANLTIGSSTATGTIGLASGATISASTKTVNVATGGVSGSTTLTTIGPVLGASTTSIGNTTAASTLNLATGATLTATTKAVNIGTSGVAGSTTNITIGSTTGTSTTTLQGATNGVTVAADTNSVALATTAYVVGQASAVAPSNDAGTAAVGTSLRYARADHVHLNPLPAGGSANQVLAKVDATSYNTQWVTPSGGGASTDYQAYETPGTFTWTKPAGAKWVDIVMFGGGGGGGSGARYATTSIRGGGGGGGGGAIIMARMSASSLSSTQSVVVGAGGSGGAAVSADSTNGANGSAGGNSTFSIFTARAGQLGNFGSNTGGGPVSSTVNGWTFGSSSSPGPGGAGASTAGTAGAAIAHTSATNATGGGGAGGATASSTVAAAGGNGGAKSAPSSLQSGMAAFSGGAGGTTGGTLPTSGVLGAVTTGGSGGGGGAYITAVAGMAGAVGGFPGGGGGGGSASDNGFASGAGGAGGGGAVYIITYC